MTAAIALPSVRLNDDESRVLEALQVQLSTFKPANDQKRDYYEAKRRMDDLKISIPPSLAGLQCCVGWPATVVDTLNERLDFEAWQGAPSDNTDPAAASDDPFGLQQVYLENDLDTESSLGHLDGLTFGTSFVFVSTGMDDEPDTLITIESPLFATAHIDARTRRARAALLLQLDNRKRLASGSLYLPNQTIRLSNPMPSEGTVAAGGWVVEDRDVHNLGRVPVAQIVNRPASGSRLGHSEITETVRSLTQSGMRTLAAAEIAREYHAAPQRFILGAKENFFTDDQGRPLPAWKSYVGRLLSLERDEFGDVPDVKQFAGASLDSFFGMMRMLAQMLSSEAGIPSNYLGFTSDNPPSADAIRAMESRLVKRAELRQKSFGAAWTQVARLAVMVRDGKKASELPAEVMRIRPKWRDASTPTQAAAADAATKLVGANILPEQHQVTWDRVGISREDQRLLEAHAAKQKVTDLITSVRGAAEKARQDATVSSLADGPAAGGNPTS